MQVKTQGRQAVDVQVVGDVQEYATAAARVSFVPLVIRRRQFRKLLVAPVGADVQAGSAVHGKSDTAIRSMDLPLIRTLGKAFYWQSLLDSGQVATVTQLAQQLKLEVGWVAEVLRMTRLAPDIVQAVLEGRQPRHLNLHTLRGRGQQVPLDWQAQRLLFGFES